MRAGPISKTIFELVEPSVHVCAAKLFVLTTGRLGAKKHQPDITTFYETGLVGSLFEHLLMSPRLRSYDIRWEMPLTKGKLGAPPRVDLWLRPAGGHRPTFIEAGDFAKKKVEDDCAKMKKHNGHPKAQNWFLAFFRTDVGENKEWIQEKLDRSFRHANGLDPAKVESHESLMRVFTVQRTNGEHERFGYAMLRAR